MSATAIAGAAVEVMTLAVEQGWFEKLRNSLRKRQRIIIVGSSGVGKTNFLKAVAEPLPDAIDAINRSEFAKRHRLSIARQAFEFLDIPGQRLHEARAKAAIRDVLKKKGRVGVISMNAFGYHEYGVARKEAFGEDGNVSAAFLEAHRRLEIDYLHMWTPLLADPAVTSFLINVVSKADLWWDQRDTVLQHYESGDYHRALGDARALYPITVSFCSVIHKFFGRMSLEGSFDDPLKKRLRAHVFQTILEAIGR